MKFFLHFFYAILTLNKDASSSFLIAFNKHLTLLHSSNFYDVANSLNVVLVSKHAIFTVLKYFSKNFVD